VGKRNSNVSGGLHSLPFIESHPQNFLVKQLKLLWKRISFPTKEQFNSQIKVTGLGIVLIGLVGFGIFMLVQLLK